MMNSGPLRVLEIYGDPSDFGRIHGTECKAMIRGYLDERLGLSGDAAWAGRPAAADTVLALAEQTLPHHRDYAPTLYEEMLAMADAAGITPAEAVVVGGFTDLVDLVRAHDGWAPIEDDCTAVIDPANGVFAQTWDMHASAGEYVLMLKLDPISGPGAVVQTTAGCLGQIGMNEAGIGIGINNLTSIGKPGVTWPFVVRKVLEQTDLDSAIDAVATADTGRGPQLPRHRPRWRRGEHRSDARDDRGDPRHRGAVRAHEPLPGSRHSSRGGREDTRACRGQRRQAGAGDEARPGSGPVLRRLFDRAACRIAR